MELKEQVVSLELAKKLKKLGVEQESLWWWIKKHSNYQLELFGRHGNTVNDISAFTAAELGEILRRALNNNDDIVFDFPMWDDFLKEWYFPHKFNLFKQGSDTCCIKAKTEANARAKMLICLKEHGDI